jgi:hypothetical protein
LNSDVCVDRLVPGEIYYVMLSANKEETVGAYRLDIESPCTPTVEPVPNYYCDFAETITQNVTPFDVAGATFDCPGPPSWCMQTMENDLWYDWTAPASGVATIQTCDGANTPDTGLVVYEGCECPVEDGRIVECNDFQRDPCFLGSKVTIPVVAGNCYKLRLGGHLGGTPSGDLQIDLQDTFEDCNRNGLPDACDIDCAAPEEDCQAPCGTSGDCNSNGKPDECELGDLDRDENVDLDDWALFMGCLTAPCGLPPCDPLLYAGIEESCCVADMEADGDVDLHDVAGFQAAFTGP